MCIDIRKSDNGTLYFAIAGGPDVPRLSPVAVDIVMEAIARHNDSIRAGLGPTIDVPLSATQSSFDFVSRQSRRPRRPTTKRASLPPVVRLPARKHVSLRLPIAIAGFLLFICVAAFATLYAFTGEPINPAKPVLFEISHPPANALPCVTGPEIK